MDNGETRFGRGFDEFDLPYLYPNIYRITFTIIPEGAELNELNNVCSKHYLIWGASNIRAHFLFMLNMIDYD